jgi:hypothetical protein
MGVIMKRLYGVFKGFFATIRKTVFTVIIICLVASNILLVTNAAFHSAVSSLFSYLPFDGLLADGPNHKLKKITAENTKLRASNKNLLARQQAQQGKIAKARTVSKRIITRTMRNLSMNLTNAALEATPYFGIAFVAASTAADVKDGCDNVEDVNEILNALDNETETQAGQLICGITVPTADELLATIQQNIMTTVHLSKGNIQDGAKNAYDALGGTIYNSKENIQTRGRKFYDALGGTLNEIFN